MCKTYQKEIDDPFITDMDPVRKMWYFNNWVADQNEMGELAKNHAYLLASFSHPEEVQKILGAGNVHESTDEEYEESLKMVKEQSAQSMTPQPIKKRRRHQLKQE